MPLKQRKKRRLKKQLGGADQTDKAEKTEKTEKTDSQTIEEIDTSEVPMDAETKAMMTEVQKLQLEITKLELLQKKSMLDLQMAHDKAVLENELQQAEEAKFQAKLSAAKTRLELENALNTEQQKQIHSQLSAEHDKAALLNSLQEDQNKQQELKMAAEVLKFSASVLDLKLQKEKLDLQLTLRDKQDDWKSQAAVEPEYLREPFVGGHLVISDRRIELGHIITRDTAKHIIEQIEFFNNKSSDYPIFLVIDTCYGGSVMEGMQILQAMRHSRSPIYVVVKAFSASMCAVITTLAQQSFALPDAILVHHQVWNLAFGNRTEQREQLKVLEEWTERLLRPVAEKMGLSLDEFIKQMYVHNSVGDWQEFANGASTSNGWIIQADIRETGYLKKLSLKNMISDEEEEEDKIDGSGNK
ncbi:MAG: ATP-dependent Clp protease proteolytic subunit [Thiotrichaceae bacterium]